ncbi:hypothetical protein IRJ41_005845 [Triplophysa rosa]|uniref:Uncharacterized protein n=1 Tax=Triplophysa rosa TaxID=992332 RepID=A0A9W8CAR4_TRIRA|nr:hypothetical protein IRJ41_005845 [Triplophysa rosa]
MTPSFVLVLVITGGVISGTGLLASWVIRFANIKFFLNSSTVISDAPQTEMIILAGTLTVAEGLTKHHLLSLLLTSLGKQQLRQQQ